LKASEETLKQTKKKETKSLLPCTLVINPHTLQFPIWLVPFSHQISLIHYTYIEQVNQCHIHYG